MDIRFRLLGKSSIDVVVNLGNLVRRINGNRWAFAFLDACEARHDVVLYFPFAKRAIFQRGVPQLFKI
jgi:hypothetical protein